MDLQFLQSIPDDRAAAVLTPDTDYSSPFNQASEAYKYGEDLFNDYQQYLICYHLQEVQTWMDEDISAGIVDEYLCELNQRDSQVPTSQSDNNIDPPTSALTPPTYSREEKQSTWSPFPINTKDEFEAIEEILAKDEEKRERFVSLHWIIVLDWRHSLIAISPLQVNFLKEHDSGNKRKLLTKWIKADALEHINMSGRTGKKKAMNCEIFLALLGKLFTFRIIASVL